MHLSVVIVNYNVKYFLEQCLCSLGRARAAMEQEAKTMEVIVVDNCSADGSIDYLQPKFPFARFIASGENLGFGRANNLAWRQAGGEYVLFLNPDTILPEDCLLQCLAFMAERPAAGALGIRMIDGSGRYLPESKRGFPSPWVSFCKMSGLCSLFPRSRLFAGYYMGQLDPQASQEVEILSGAFMLVKKEALHRTGGFDERFFMYAEDIDLSYSILQAGFRNYYFAGCTILHFKGESTRKDARYVKLFYEAMILFVRKHFRGATSWWYIRLLEMAIRLKARVHRTGTGPGQPATARSSIALLGDKDGCTRFREKAGATLPGPVTSELTAANTWILCEGPGFSFRQVVEKLQQLPDGITAFIHGRDTGSAAGSHSKDEQGRVIVL